MGDHHCASGGMADALASGASARKGVGVQVPPRARLGTTTFEGFHRLVDSEGIRNPVKDSGGQQAEYPH